MGNLKGTVSFKMSATEEKKVIVPTFFLQYHIYISQFKPQIFFLRIMTNSKSQDKT